MLFSPHWEEFVPPLDEEWSKIANEGALSLWIFFCEKKSAGAALLAGARRELVLRLLPNLFGCFVAFSFVFEYMTLE